MPTHGRKALLPSSWDGVTADLRSTNGQLLTLLGNRSPSANFLQILKKPNSQHESRRQRQDFLKVTLKERHVWRKFWLKAENVKHHWVVRIGWWRWWWYFKLLFFVTSHWKFSKSFFQVKGRNLLRGTSYFDRILGVSKNVQRVV